MQRTKRSEVERRRAMPHGDTHILEIPIVYVGDRETAEPNVKGVIYRFVKGIARHVPVPVANLLINRGCYKHLSDVDSAIYNDPKKWVKTILVARTLHSIGDMIMASVTPKALKRKYPGSYVSITVPQKSFPLWYHNPWVDELIEWNGNYNLSRSFDLYFDITRPCVRYEQSYHPSKKQRIDIYMEHCGATLPDDDKQPFYMVTQDEREWAHRVTEGRFFFGLQLRANAPIRNWMAGANCPQDRNRQIVERWLAMNNGVDVIVFDEHRELADQYNHPRIFKRPGSGIREMFALMERCVQMQTLDSGLLHGCGALGIPVVALFGNIHPQARTIYYRHAMPLFRPDACPHHRAPCNGDCGHQYCLEGISVEEVWGADLRTWETVGKERLRIMQENEALNRGPITQGRIGIRT